MNILSRRERRRSLGAAIALLAAGTVSMSMMSPAQGARAGGADADHPAYPGHFTDNTGVSLQLCEDGTPNCHDAVVGDLEALGEALYYSAAATVASGANNLDIEFALEALVNEETTEPEVVDAMIIRGHVARRGTWTLQHPYGTTRFQATAATDQENVRHIVETVCPEAGACTGGRLSTFLRSTRPPSGYMGDVEIPGRVTAGPQRNNVVLRNPAGKVVASTNQFEVMGMIAEGAAAVVPSSRIEMGARNVKFRAIRVRNLGTEELQINGVSVIGSPRLNRAATSTCTPGSTVAAGGACSVVVRYRPAAPGSTHRARVVINSNALGGITRMGIVAHSR